MNIDNKKIRIKIKKNVKYSICSCGYSKKLPYCDNQHRLHNQENNTDYKSVKIYPDKDVSIQLSCSKWKSKDDE